MESIYDNLTDEDMKPRTWEELTPLEREIKTEEFMLRELLRILKDKKDSYSILLMRLILGELKNPRL